MSRGKNVVVVLLLLLQMLVWANTHWSIECCTRAT